MINIVKSKMVNTRIYNRLNRIQEFFKEEKGMGVVEVILIVVVLVGLVFIFKDKMNTIVSSMFQSITDGISKVTT